MIVGYANDERGHGPTITVFAMAGGMDAYSAIIAKELELIVCSMHKLKLYQ